MIYLLQYIYNNSVRLIENNNYHINYTNKEVYDKYKKLFIKYKSSASLIPIKIFFIVFYWEFINL